MESDKWKKLPHDYIKFKMLLKQCMPPRHALSITQRSERSWEKKRRKSPIFIFVPAKKWAFFPLFTNSSLSLLVIVSCICEKAGCLTVKIAHLAVKAGLLTVKTAHLTVKAGLPAIKATHLTVKAERLTVKMAHLAVKASRLTVKIIHLAVRARRLTVKAAQPTVKAARLTVKAGRTVRSENQSVYKFMYRCPDQFVVIQ
jgi:hypothetical protein